MEEILDAIEQKDTEKLQKILTSKKDLDKNSISSLIKSIDDQNIKMILLEAIHSSEASFTDLSSDKSSEYEDIEEKQALEKYKFSNPKHDKALELFFNGFKANIEGVKFDKVGKLSKSIVDHLISEYPASFPKEVRSKSHNLKENKKLCINVYFGNLETADFVRMSPAEMQSEELRSKNNKIIKESILASQFANTAAETDMFKCSRCKQKKCTYSQLQTRSCDEPMTTFVSCTVCGHRWKF